jgi:hypothetical protein
MREAGKAVASTTLVNEGRILEDVGIVPDILDQMTERDVTEQNQDLFDRAGKELISPAA